MEQPSLDTGAPSDAAMVSRMRSFCNWSATASVMHCTAKIAVRDSLLLRTKCDSERRLLLAAAKMSSHSNQQPDDQKLDVGRHLSDAQSRRQRLLKRNHMPFSARADAAKNFGVTPD